MQLTNSTRLYGTVAKTFHWLTALLIFTALPLGVIANDMPYETSEELARKAQLFSLHKTVGVAIFFVAVARILWALGQPKPAPLHPERRMETFAAEVVHWSLYASLVIVPLSGWIHHAASEGYAPILWPLGQSLPLVPKSPLIMEFFGSLHWVVTKILFASLVLHVAGALKHAILDKDATLARMLPGQPDIDTPSSGTVGQMPAALLAGGVYAAGIALAVVLTDVSDAAERPGAPALADTSEMGDWDVQDGTVAIVVSNFGNDVNGSFADWTAAITFSENADDGRHGDVSVEVSIPSLTLGSVTDQAMGPEYFNVEDFPTARYEAEILSSDTGYVAEGTLTLKGNESPVSLPFTLDIEGDTARMQGSTTLDRRNYEIGTGQTDEGTLGFTVDLNVELTATRK